MDFGAAFSAERIAVNITLIITVNAAAQNV